MNATEEFCQQALAFAEAVEQAHFGKVSFRVGQKIFATLTPDGQRATLKLSAVDQSVFCGYDAALMYPAAGRWGRQGWTIVELSRVPAAMLLDALTCAYCQVAPPDWPPYTSATSLALPGLDSLIRVFHPNDIKSRMKRSIWLGMAVLLLAGPARAQSKSPSSLAGIWQGVETDPKEPGATWPSLLRLQAGKGSGLFGIHYEEDGRRPGVTVTFQVQATRTATGLLLKQVRKLNETGATPGSYWCEGNISFTYDAEQEKLTGRAAYDPVGDCDHGNFTLYRVKLKSAATVPAGAETTIRVSGRDVRWYADPELKQPLTSGNTYRTRLRKTTTFYLTQGYYRTRESAVVPITVQVGGAAPKPAPARPAATPAPAPEPALPPLDTARRPAAPAPPVISEKPVVLPTVLFKLGTAELLAEAFPALNQLAAELRQRPALRLQIAGHTDRLGEPQKNLVLSEQRAEAVKSFLVKGGIEPGRLSTVGYGDTRPLYPSPDARNRRVEVAEVK